MDMSTTTADHTAPTTDAVAWLEENFPEGDVAIEHTSECDHQSVGDECLGGCPIVIC